MQYVQTSTGFNVLQSYNHTVLLVWIVFLQQISITYLKQYIDLPLDVVMT